MKTLFEFLGGLIWVAVLGYYLILPLGQSGQYAKINNLSNETVIVNVCYDRIACPKFKEARDQCAVAGDYGKCMNIKMADQDTYFCRKDGGSERLDEINANALFCQVTKVGFWFFSSKN